MKYIERKLRVIEVVDELAGLMDGTVIVDGEPICCERIGGKWYVPATRTPYGDHEITLPATVLHEPGAAA